MLSKEDQDHLKRLKKVAYKLNLPEEVIQLTLNYVSEYIKDKISSIELDYDDLLTKEEFEEKFPIINIRNLGYLKPDYFKYKHTYTKAKKSRDKKIK